MRRSLWPFPEDNNSTLSRHITHNCWKFEHAKHFTIYVVSKKPSPRITKKSWRNISLLLIDGESWTNDSMKVFMKISNLKGLTFKPATDMYSQETYILDITEIMKCLHLEEMYREYCRWYINDSRHVIIIISCRERVKNYFHKILCKRVKYMQYKSQIYSDPSVSLIHNIFSKTNRYL